MIRKIFIPLACFLLFCSQGNAQSEAEIRHEQERFAERQEKMKTQIINDIVEALKVDAFEKQIVTQSIESYLKEVTKIYMLDLPVFEKKDLVVQLEDRHFNDLKAIISQEQIDFILNQIKGDWKKDQKKKKKKKRKKKSDN